MSIRYFAPCAAMVLFAATASAQSAGGPAPSPAAQPADLGGAAGTGTSTEPTFELTGGYQFLHAGEDLSFPFGLNVDGARNFGRSLGLVAEIGWSVRNQDVEGLDDEDFNLHEWTFSAGPRWNGRGGRIWPFAQVLAGAAYIRARGDLAGGGEDSEATAHFMLQPGFGVNFIAGDGWGFVGQFDYRRLFMGDDEDGDVGDVEDDDNGESQYRVFFGVRVILD